MVKPILKRLASSPKNSLDLDRGWEEQPVDFGGYGNGANESGRPSMSRSIRDVSFHPSTWEPSGFSSSGGAGAGHVGGSSSGGGGSIGGGGSTTGSGTATPVNMSGIGLGGAGGNGLGIEAASSSLLSVGGVMGIPGVTTSASTRNTGGAGGRFTHARSTSGTSHVSIATNGSSHRPGASFVHPFQQTPRTNTPPLAYAHSFTSFERENNPARDYSPTIITENEDDDDFDNLNPASSPLLSQSQSTSLHVGSHAHSQTSTNNSHHTHSTATSSLRRPSFASQSTSSLSDIRGAKPPSLRVNTTTTNALSTSQPPPRSVPSASSKLAHGAFSPDSYSHSDLALNTSPTDSPRPSLHLASPSTSTTAAMSPLRTSLEGAFRLRSRSEVETGVSRVDIREARRKFEEDERIKQEKYEAEQRRKQERRQEREKSLLRKNTGGSDMSIIGRPSFSRKRTPPPLVSAKRTRSGESSAGGGATAMSEKMPNQPSAAAFMSSNYESTEGGAAPDFGLDVNDVRFESPPRAHTTKRKTQSYWTSFVLWFRTRLLRLGRH